MIVTVTPNPALDLTWHVAKIVPGGTHRADAGAARAGGKGLNVARVAHDAGAEAVAVTTIGGATGEEFRAELTNAGVPAVLVPVAAATRRSIALVDEELGDTTIVNERGIAPADAEWEALRDAVSRSLGAPAPRSLSEERSDETKAARPEGERPVLVISGSVPPGTPDDLIPSLIALGHDAGAIVIADTSGPALLRAADAGADVLKPNAAELAEATGIPDPIDGACELLRRGASLILLSRGADGMLAVSADGAGAPVGDHGRSGLSSAGRAAPRRVENVSSVTSDELAGERSEAVGAGAPMGNHRPSDLSTASPAAARRAEDVSSVVSDGAGAQSAVAADAGAVAGSHGSSGSAPAGLAAARRVEDVSSVTSDGAGVQSAGAADAGAAVGNHGPSGPAPAGLTAPRRAEDVSSVTSDGAVAQSATVADTGAAVGNHGPSGPAPAGLTAPRRAEDVSSVISDELDVIAARLPEVLAGNPTGAGDAAVAAAAVLLAAGIRDPEAILRRATAWSAAAVLMPLAGDIHPSWPELEAAVIITREKRLPAREARAERDSHAAGHLSPEAKDSV